ncbi:hypothetical protein VPH35_001045 [Triticum aestivum]
MPYKMGRSLRHAAHRSTQQHTNTTRSLTLSRVAATKGKNGAGEGVRAGHVDERGPGAGVPGGGRRRVRGGRHRFQGHGAQEPRASRQKPVRPNPCFPGWGSASLRVTRNCKVRASQVQEERSRPAEGRQPQGGRHGGCMDGGRRAHLQPGHLADRVRVPHQPADARPADQPDGGGRKPGEAEEGAGGLRGAPVPARVPRRGLRQLRRPQPLPLHLLLHGHASRGALRLVPARQGLVGEAHGEAGRQEARRTNGSQEAVIC